MIVGSPAYGKFPRETGVVFRIGVSDRRVQGRVSLTT